MKIGLPLGGVSVVLRGVKWKELVEEGLKSCRNSSPFPFYFNQSYQTLQRILSPNFAVGVGEELECVFSKKVKAVIMWTRRQKAF